jgi:hypothetical protein
MILQKAMSTAEKNTFIFPYFDGFEGSISSFIFPNLY